MTKRTIAVNAEYRLLIADADNVAIERLTTVDPTKSPAYDPAKHDGAIRTEWRNIGKHFGTIPKALTFLCEYAPRNGVATELREIVAEVREFRALVSELLGDGV